MTGYNPADPIRIANANEALGAWLSAALDDPNVCDAMKTDINEWFAAHAGHVSEVAQLREALEKIAALKPFAVQSHHLPVRGLGDMMVCSPEAVLIAQAALAEQVA